MIMKMEAMEGMLKKMNLSEKEKGIRVVGGEVSRARLAKPQAIEFCSLFAHTSFKLVHKALSKIDDFFRSFVGAVPTTRISALDFFCG
jgi:hypothetical protein